MRLKVSDVCQLLDKSKYPATQTVNGVTFTNNGDGTITANGTVTTAGGIATVWISSISLIKGNKYIIAGGPKGGNNKKWSIMGQIYTDDGKWIVNVFDLGSGKTFVAPSEESTYLSVYLQFWASTSDLIYKPQFFDLTEMYGAGNEPTTVAQFRQDFPNEMYDYSPECWKKFRRLKYVTETKNLFDVNNAVPYTLHNENPPSNRISLKDGIYTSTYNNYNVGTGLRIKNGLVLSPGTYTLSLNIITVGETNPITGLTYGFELYKSDGTKPVLVTYTEVRNSRVSHAFTIPTDCTDIRLYLSPHCQNGQNYVYISLKDIQLEQGSTASPYQPYGYLPLRRGKYIANKQPVQLLDKSRYPATCTKNGITYTKNEDGSYDVNGTIAETRLSILLIGTAEMVAGHIYLNNTILVKGQKSYVEFKFWRRDLQRWVFPGQRFQCGNYSAYAQITLLVNQTAGTVISDEKLCPELFDLTEMYGAGNEPTAEEFWATHLKTTMYDYNPYNAITFR